MDELYDYLQQSLSQMRRLNDDFIEIDMDHALRLFHMICYMKQIRGIIEFQDDSCENGKHEKKNVR